METNHQKDIIIFDGECNLCNGVIGWLMKFAPTATFNFIPFQSPKGQRFLHYYNKPTNRLDTVILINQTGMHTHSDGFLKIIAEIPKWRRVAALLAFIPRMLRDYVYKTASRNRLGWFGVSKSCTITFR